MLTFTLNEVHIDDWPETLAMIQLAYNNTVITLTGFSPNEMTFGANTTLNETIWLDASGIPEADELAENMKAIIASARENLMKTQADQAKYYNQGRRGVAFKEGDLVLLSWKGLDISTSKKYTHPYLGPFTVQEALPHDNYKLKLHASMKRLHNTFHVSKLCKYNEPPADSRQALIQRPPPVVIENEDQYEVHYIEKHRFRKSGKQTLKQYFVHWKGYDRTESDWYWADDIQEDAPDACREYEMSAAAKTTADEEERNNKPTTRKRKSRA